MKIDDRLRRSMRRAAGDARPGADAWAAIERGVERRRRRARAIRTGGGAILALAFLGALTWGGLALRGHRHVGSAPGDTLVVSGVKVMPSTTEGPGVAKLYGSLTNEGTDPTGAFVACSLRDANGNEVTKTGSALEYIAPHATVTFGAGTAYRTAPVDATCDAQPRAAVSPSPPEPQVTRFQLGGAAFFDAENGVAVGSFGTSGCESGCSGLIERTSDGGRTWTTVDKTKFPIVSVAVSGNSDAWAVEDDACAYICPALLRSTDGGKTWTDLGEVNVVNPSFGSPSLGFGFGYRRDAMTAPLLRTADGGGTWQPTGSECDAPTAWGTFASFVTPTHGWVLCDGQPSAGSQSRTLFETTDGGSTLTPVPASGLGSSGYPQAVTFRPDGTGWIGLGDATLSVLRTTDGGRSWEGPVTIDANGGEIHSLSFLDDTTGYAVVSIAGSPADRLLRTTDGGDHWTTVFTWQAAS